MQLSLALCSAVLATSVVAAPAILKRADACFVIGSSTLPQEVEDSVTEIKSSITCDTSKTTISKIPDVTSGSTTFSDIDFSQSSDSPLKFALDNFQTAKVLADTDLETLQDQINVYTATQAGIRSVGSNPAAIKIPTFFLQFQRARVLTAQGTAITNPSLTVEHQLGKVLKNAASDDKVLLDQVTALSKVLA